MKLRADNVVATDDCGERPAVFGLRDQVVLEPISDQVVATLRAEGLDLTRPGSDAEPLNEIQKSQLAALFRVVGQGCRDAGGQPATATNPND